MRILRGFWATRRGKILISAAAALVVFIGAAFGAAAYTERSAFCAGSCHEMLPYGSTWRSSAHAEIECVECHIEPGIINFVEAKVSALREVWVHWFGEVKKPIPVTDQIDDDVCASEECHPRHEIRKVVLIKETPLSHEAHDDVVCRDCHRQVVHHSVPGRPFDDPTSMAFCLTCHDGEMAASACETCHQPPHPARGACTDCHTATSWASTFEHPVRLASHRKIECERCHTRSTNRGMGFPLGCVSCHERRHGPKLVRCANCHRNTRWRPSTFTHPRTGCLDCHDKPHPDRGACLTCHTTTSWASHFAHPVALGAHNALACERCHRSGLGSPPPRCASCHGNRHGGNLADCRRCHTMSYWSPASFRHPAVGEHIPGGEHPLTCSACHPAGLGTSSCSCHGPGGPEDGDNGDD